MSTPESIAMEAAEEAELEARLKREGISMEDYEKEQKNKEILEDLRKQKIDIVKQARDIHERMESMYRDLVSYNDSLDDNGLREEDNSAFLKALLNQINGIDMLTTMTNVEMDGIKKLAK